MAEFFYGIDFGACNLKCVRLDDRKSFAVRLNTKDDGSFHTPNAICYSKDKDGQIQTVIGQIALNRGALEPENLVIGLKRKLEQKDWRKFIPVLGREVNASEVTEDILKKIYAVVSGNFSKDDIARAVVTVPVIFTRNQRQKIANAVSAAGFQVDGIINEAFAAIFAMKELNDSFNVVFDFGGSTLDVSVIKITGNEIHELAATGIRLGGLDIDRDILEKIFKPKYKDILNAAWAIENSDDFQMNFARQMKEAVYEDEFSESICAEEVIAQKDFDKITLSRDEIEEILDSEGYGKKIIALLDDLFEKLSEGTDCADKSDVTNILALGGSLKIPYFRKLLEDYFGSELFDAQDYDFEAMEEFSKGLENKYLVVAGGAANFLKKRETVTTINAIPYRVCFSIGNDRLRQGLAKNSPAGFETLYLPLSIDDLEAANWKIELYQTFDDEAKLEDAAFLESIQLNSALYEKKESPLLKLKMMRDGRLRLRIGERRTIDDESEFILLEQHFVRLEV